MVKISLRKNLLLKNKKVKGVNMSMSLQGEELKDSVGFPVTYKDGSQGELIYVNKSRGLLITIDIDNDIIHHYFDGRARSPFSNNRNIIFPDLGGN